MLSMQCGIRGDQSDQKQEVSVQNIGDETKRREKPVAETSANRQV